MAQNDWPAFRKCCFVIGSVLCFYSPRTVACKEIKVTFAYVA